MKLKHAHEATAAELDAVAESVVEDLARVINANLIATIQKAMAHNGIVGAPGEETYITAVRIARVMLRPMGGTRNPEIGYQHKMATALANLGTSFRESFVAIAREDMPDDENTNLPARCENTGYHGLNPRPTQCTLPGGHAGKCEWAAAS